jgi:hypothetical protein
MWIKRYLSFQQIVDIQLEIAIGSKSRTSFISIVFCIVLLLSLDAEHLRKSVFDLKLLSDDDFLLLLVLFVRVRTITLFMFRSLRQKSFTATRFVLVIMFSFLLLMRAFIYSVQIFKSCLCLCMLGCTF